MPVTLEQASAIMQAVTIDVWNNESKSERLKLMEKYCAHDMKAYAPDGNETIGYEDVRQIVRSTVMRITNVSTV